MQTNSLIFVEKKMEEKNVYERIRERVKPETKEKVRREMQTLMQAAKRKKIIWGSITFITYLSLVFFAFNYVFSIPAFKIDGLDGGKFAVIFMLLIASAVIGGIISELFHEKFQ